MPYRQRKQVPMLQSLAKFKKTSSYKFYPFLSFPFSVEMETGVSKHETHSPIMKMRRGWWKLSY